MRKIVPGSQKEKDIEFGLMIKAHDSVNTEQPLPDLSELC